MKKILFFLIIVTCLTVFSEDFEIKPVVINAYRTEKAEEFINDHKFYDNDFNLFSEMDTFFSQNSITYQNNSSPGSPLTAGLDGAFNRHTLKTFDGVKLNSRASGDFDISLLDPEMISSISIIRNSASGIFGGQGSGGVMSFRGLNYSHPVIGVKVGYAGLKKIYYKDHLNNTGSIFVSNREYNGVRAWDSGRQNTFYLKNNVDKIQYSLLITDRFKKIAGASNFPTIGNWQDDGMNIWSIQYEPRKNLSCKIGFIDRRTDFYDKTEDKVQPTDYTTLNIEAVYRKKGFSGGVSHEKTDFDSKQFIDTDSDFVSDSWDISEKDENITSFFIEKLLKGQFFVTARYDDHSEFDSETVYNVYYRPDDSISIGYGKGYYTPTFQDLYWPVETFAAGNPNLTPEESDNYSFEYSTDDLRVYIYRNEYTDLIEWDGNYPDFRWRPTNVSEATVNGIDIDYEINKSISLFFSYCDPEKSNGDKLNYRELNGGGLVYRPDEKSEIILRKIGRRYFAPGVFDKSVYTADINWNNKNSSLSIQNVTDKNYTIMPNYPDAERKVVFSIEIPIQKSRK